MALKNDTKKYAQKCSVTGKGMNEGWYINGDCYSTQEYADKAARELKDDNGQYYKNFGELYSDCENDNETCDFAYWTTWYDTIADDDDYYNEEGQLFRTCHKCKEETTVNENFYFCTECLTHL